MSQPVPVPGREQAIGGGTGRTLEEHYELLDVLGRGSFSVVHRARHRQTNEMFACKVIDKWSIHNRQRLANEIEVLQRVSHPSVIRLHDIFETDRVLALVTDIAAGGELFDKIVDKGHYSEKEASDVACRLLHAVGHLHSHGIVHRDIKPENILLAGTGSDVEVKLSDFGLAKIFSRDDLSASASDEHGAGAHGVGAGVGAGGGAFNKARAFTVCGTDYYVAPEVLQQAGYTHACDLWSIGVVLYILLSGCPPFYEGGEEGISVQRKIIAGAYSFPERYWGAVSAEAKDLVSHLLQTDPLRRYTVQQSLAHPWLSRGGAKEGSLPRANAELFRTFNNKRKNSIAGSPLVGSYSLFGSLQSPADSSFHMPGKHKRHALVPAGPLGTTAGAGAGAMAMGGAAGAGAMAFGGCGGGMCAACGGCGCSPAGAGAGCHPPLPTHMAAGRAAQEERQAQAAAAAAAARPPFGGPQHALPPGSAAADLQSQPQRQGGAGAGGCGYCSCCGGGGGCVFAPCSSAAAPTTLGVPIPGCGMPIPQPGRGGGCGCAGGAGSGSHHYHGHELSGSLSSSPPVGLLSASPNPGAAFLMEI